MKFIHLYTDMLDKGTFHSKFFILRLKSHILVLFKSPFPPLSIGVSFRSLLAILEAVEATVVECDKAKCQIEAKFRASVKSL